MIRQILFIAIGLALAPGAQAAKMYKCVNAQGQIEYRQTYDPHTCNQGGSQMNDQGLAVKKIDRPKTAEEIAAEKAAAAAAFSAAISSAVFGRSICLTARPWSFSCAPPWLQVCGS